MFSPLFKVRSIIVPVAIIAHGTNNPNVAEYGIYLFGIRVATYDKYL